MKTGIIGLPQVGKTSLFKILTKVKTEERGHNPREAHLGVAKVPDERLDKLAALHNPKKLIHARRSRNQPMPIIFAWSMP
jgi:ribosome-binding ATPase YchF (GTP1/OBG family)